MRKIYSFLFLAAVAGMSANAQQLPNVGFEEDWTKSYPWNSVYTELSLADAIQAMVESGLVQPTEGLQPAGWIASNVLGVVSEKDGGGYGALGSTEIVFKAEGRESATAVLLKSNPNPFMASQIVPAYLSLGKTWATNGLDFSAFTPINKDGGAFGGLEFTGRPDALTFYYKRAHGEENAAEKATVVVYSWKGSWTQADVPANNTMFEYQIVKVDMVDRDRNILGIATDQGGAVTHTEDAALIGKLIYDIEGDAAEWTRFEQPIEYLTVDTPEKINVIISANDYFNSDAIGNGNQLTVDDVMFVYYSRLASVKVGGVAVPDFKSDVYSYDLTGAVPAAEDVECELLGQGKTSKTAVTVEGNTVKVTVTNDNPDVDGETSHVYTLNYKAAEAGESDIYAGFLTIKSAVLGDIAENQAANIHITPEGGDKCTISLPNFTLDLGGGPASLGDIVVPGVKMTVANGVTSYVGRVEGLSLMDGAIVADADVTGTTNAVGDADFTISVLFQNIPIDVTFTGKKTSGIGNVTVDAEAPVEYYNINGMRVDGDNLQSGLYIRRQGNTVTKVLVK